MSEYQGNEGVHSINVMLDVHGFLSGNLIWRRATWVISEGFLENIRKSFTHERRQSKYNDHPEIAEPVYHQNNHTSHYTEENGRPQHGKSIWKWHENASNPDANTTKIDHGSGE